MVNMQWSGSKSFSLNRLASRGKKDWLHVVKSSRIFSLKRLASRGKKKVDKWGGE